MAFIVGITEGDRESKTAAAEALIAELTKRGHSVGAIKGHGHGVFDLDKPGKASYRHREAGARHTVMSSPEMLASIVYRNAKPSLAEAAALFGPDIDIIVADGLGATADFVVTAPLVDVLGTVDAIEERA